MAVSSVQAQTEVGVKIGGANYYGDIAPRLVPSATRPSLGLFTRINMTPKWNWTIGGQYSRISGHDKNNNEFADRNLNFRTNIAEIYTQIEYNLLPFQPGTSTFTFTPYLFVGVNGFRYQTQAETTEGSFLNLRELGTEGQTIPGSNMQPYSEFSLAVPFGIGIKKTLAEGVIFGLEASFRPTITDFLDDVSGLYPDFVALALTDGGATAVKLSDRRPELGLEPAQAGTYRGNPDNKDWYGWICLTITKKLGSSPCYAF